jgi:hypothetical protein
LFFFKGMVSKMPPRAQGRDGNRRKNINISNRLRNWQA